ncbi:hypothetical protein EON65_22625 [archaeon]|nr:MAG: hypothetical protein EON65_22625 [archaeon]
MGELRYKKAEADRARLVKDLVESRQHIRDKVRQAIEQAEAVAVDEQFKAFHRRRAEQHAEEENHLRALEQVHYYANYSSLSTALTCNHKNIGSQGCRRKSCLGTSTMAPQVLL